jgi:hypothetical protein
MTRYALAGTFGALMLALTGCSFFSHSVTWTKSGVTDTQAQDDLATCTEQAKVQTDRDTSVDNDIAATESGTNAVDSSPLQNIQAYKHDNRFKSVLKDCMSQLGYREAD